MSSEEWRPIPGLEGEYEVSSLGRVRSLDRIERGPKNRRRKGRILSQDGSSLYFRVSLPVVGEKRHQRRFKVHRLVAEAFLGPPPADKPLVDHINEDKWDNRLENLRYVSYKENRDHTTVVSCSGIKFVWKNCGGKRPWIVKKGAKYYGSFWSIEDAAALAASL